MTEAFSAVAAAGGILVIGALLGLGLGWGVIAGIRAAGGVPHKLNWNNELKAVCSHRPSDQGNQEKVEVIH